VAESWGFGVARADAVTTTQAVLGEICSIGSLACGERLVPRFAADYRELADMLKRGTLGIAWMPPIPALEAEDAGYGTVLALPARRGMATYHAAFITKKGGPRDLKECKGKRVAWVDAESASGYVIPRMHLASMGLEMKGFFSGEAFVKSHTAVVEAVALGRADVGATFCSLDPATKRVLTAGWTSSDGRPLFSVETIATAGPIPNDAIVASAQLPLPVRASLRRWLLQLAQRDKDLFQQLLRASEFRTFPDGHFDPLKHTIRVARARGFSMPPPPKV